MNRNQRRAKAKQAKKKTQNKQIPKKIYDPLENSNEQPFKEHMLHMKEAHDVGHLLWLLNTGRLILPHHQHKLRVLNLQQPPPELKFRQQNIHI